MSNVRKMPLGFTGVAGFHFWDGRDPKEDGSYHTELWKNTFRAQNHMNGNDVINTLSEGGGYWSHGMGRSEIKNHKDETEALETQYYKSNDKKKIVGYVKNRTYNIATMGTDSTCINSIFEWGIDSIKLPSINILRNLQWNDARNGQRLRIDDSYNLMKKYDFDFYSFKTGDWIGSTSKLPSIGGTIKIEYPELTTNGSGQINPVIWFVATRRGTSMMIVNDGPENEDYMANNIEEVLLVNEENAKESKVYPNPFHNFLNVQSSINDNLILTDIHGRVLLEKGITSGFTRVSTGNITNGIYMVNLVEQNIQFKLIKQ